MMCYLVERLRWRLEDAIELKVKKPPVIRHSYFLDELWGRYWTRWGGKEGTVKRVFCTLGNDSLLN
jgi:hypothetical protein